MLVMGKSGDQGSEEHYTGARYKAASADDIMSSTVEYLYSDWHWTFGWLRRPDRDETYGYCYEEPDGDLIYFADHIAKDSVFLDVMADLSTGDRYLCLSHRPPIPHGKKMKAKR